MEVAHGLCHCGCGEKAPLAPANFARRGWVKGQPQRFVHGHNGRKYHGDPWVVDDATGCWVWRWGVGRNGYGNISLGDRRTGRVSFRAHRFVYLCEIGPIPEDLELDHLCRNRLCVNPAHLEPVTHLENVRRGWAARGWRKTW